MKYDYTLKITKGDKVKAIGYQAFLKLVGIENEIVHGAPLSEGGAPQAQTVAVLAKDAFKADSVTVYFNGSAILAA